MRIWVKVGKKTVDYSSYPGTQKKAISWALAPKFLVEVSSPTTMSGRGVCVGLARRRWAEQSPPSQEAGRSTLTEERADPPPASWDSWRELETTRF